MKRILCTCTLAALLTMPLHMSGSQAWAVDTVKWNTNSEAVAEALLSEFSGRHDYNALVAVKLANVALEERGQNDRTAARQFLILAEEHAARARSAK